MTKCTINCYGEPHRLSVREHGYAAATGARRHGTMAMGKGVRMQTVLAGAIVYFVVSAAAKPETKIAFSSAAVMGIFATASPFDCVYFSIERAMVLWCSWPSRRPMVTRELHSQNVCILTHETLIDD